MALPDHRPVFYDTAGSKRRSLLMAGKDDEMFMTRSLNVAPKTTEQHLIARSDKSVAYVSARRFILLNLTTAIESTTDRHEASCVLFARAELGLLAYNYKLQSL